MPMDIYETRRVNVRHYIDDECSGNAAEFARRVKRSPSYINRVISDSSDPHHKNLGEDLARDFEKLLELPNDWFDTPFGATEEETVKHFKDLAQHQKDAAKHEGSSIIGWNNQDELGEGYVFIDRYDLKFESGNGHIQWEIDKLSRPLAFTIEFLRERNINAKESFIATNKGRSMEPYLMDGDTMVIDRSKVHPLKDDEAYAIRYGESFRMKRIRRKVDGSVELVSDNPDKASFPTETVPKDQVDNITVIGMLMWRAG